MNAMQTAIHAEPWECKHVEHALTRTYLYYYLPDPNFAARLIIGYGGRGTLKSTFEERSFSAFHCPATK